MAARKMNPTSVPPQPPPEEGGGSCGAGAGATGVGAGAVGVVGVGAGAVGPAAGVVGSTVAGTSGIAAGRVCADSPLGTSVQASFVVLPPPLGETVTLPAPLTTKSKVAVPWDDRVMVFCWLFLPPSFRITIPSAIGLLSLPVTCTSTFCTSLK